VLHRRSTGFFPFLLTGHLPYGHLWSETQRRTWDVASYEVTLKDGTSERIDDADAYRQEGPMTTFFQHEGGRQVVDCWSTRLASFRTAEIIIIRRRETTEPLTIGPHLEAAS